LGHTAGEFQPLTLSIQKKVKGSIRTITLLIRWSAVLYNLGSGTWA